MNFYELKQHSVFSFRRGKTTFQRRLKMSSSGFQIELSYCSMPILILSGSCALLGSKFCGILQYFLRRNLQVISNCQSYNANDREIYCHHRTLTSNCCCFSWMKDLIVLFNHGGSPQTTVSWGINFLSTLIKVLLKIETFSFTLVLRKVLSHLKSVTARLIISVFACL